MTQEQKEALSLAFMELEEIVEMVSVVTKVPGIIKPEKFLWRCVDIAGLLASVYPDALGAKHGTIRGFQVIRTEPYQPVCVHVTNPLGEGPPNRPEQEA